MEGRKAFAASLISIGIFLAVVTLAVGVLRGNWSLAVVLTGLAAWFLIEPGWWVWLLDERSTDRNPPQQGS